MPSCILLLCCAGETCWSGETSAEISCGENRWGENCTALGDTKQRGSGDGLVLSSVTSTRAHMLPSLLFRSPNLRGAGSERGDGVFIFERNWSSLLAIDSAF